MDDQRSPLAERHYPQVPNNLVNDPTPKDQAIYPALFMTSRRMCLNSLI